MEPRFLTPLTADEQLAQGLPAAVPMAMADRVRFSEMTFAACEQQGLPRLV